MARGRLLAALLLLAPLGAPAQPPASVTPPPGRPTATSGAPFDLSEATPHRIDFTVDSAPARDMLALVTASPDAPAALRRLKAGSALPKLLARVGASADDTFGRLVSAAAGTPDSLLQTYRTRADVFRLVLEELDRNGPAFAAFEGRRIGSMLPDSSPVSARLVLVPVFGTAGFADVEPVHDGDSVFLFADLARLTNDPVSVPTPREVVLKVFRAASSAAWQLLFDERVRRPPAWPDETRPDFDTILSRTAAEGPATLFLFPDEFFPLASLLDEPIGRAFARWNRAADRLADPRLKESERRDVISDLSRGEFWNRSTAIVGAQMTDALMRLVGRAEYLRAVAAGPRAVATLYQAASKGTKLPAFGRSAKKALETRAKDSQVPRPGPAPTGTGGAAGP